MSLIRCISLWQPWGTLVVTGRKVWETRSWPALHAGQLAIHAAKRWGRDLEDLCREEPFRSLLESIGYCNPVALPKGAIIGTVNVAAYYRVALEGRKRILRRVGGGDAEPLPNPTQLALGDFSPGRHVWRLFDAERWEPQQRPGRRGSWWIEVLPA